MRGQRNCYISRNRQGTKRPATTAMLEPLRHCVRETSCGVAALAPLREPGEVAAASKRAVSLARPLESRFVKASCESRKTTRVDIWQWFGRTEVSDNMLHVITISIPSCAKHTMQSDRYVVAASATTTTTQLCMYQRVMITVMTTDHLNSREHMICNEFDVKTTEGTRQISLA